VGLRLQPRAYGKLMPDRFIKFHFENFAVIGTDDCPGKADAHEDTTDPGLLPGDEAAIDYARGSAEELWKDRQPGEPDTTVFVKNAEGIIMYSAPLHET